jgi:hypothetical protein
MAALTPLLLMIITGLVATLVDTVMFFGFSRNYPIPWLSLEAGLAGILAIIVEIRDIDALIQTNGLALIFPVFFGLPQLVYASWRL